MTARPSCIVSATKLRTPDHCCSLTAAIFSSAKILLEDRRSRLRMDIVEANELLRHSCGPPPQGALTTMTWKW